MVLVENDVNDPLFNKFTFLAPISDTDKLITLKEVGGNVIFQLNSYSITSTYSKSIYIYVKSIGTDKLSKLRFSTEAEAIAALQILQAAIQKVNDGKKSDLSFDDIAFINNQITIYIGNTKYHQSFTASSVWTVVHNFYNNSTYYNANYAHRPSVTTVDVNGNEIEGLVKYINQNTLSISFNKPVTGWVFLN